jgi:hypothetical protein
MAKQATNRFKSAVEKTPDIEKCYKVGLRALGSNSTKVSMGNPSLCNGSVEIDKCVKSKYPNTNRWDYCFSYKGEAHFVEVHSAYTSEINTVLRKLKWLKEWLISEAPEINKLRAKEPFYWLQSGKNGVLTGSSQYRRLVIAGIKPVSRLSLK